MFAGPSQKPTLNDQSVSRNTPRKPPLLYSNTDDHYQEMIETLMQPQICKIQTALSHKDLLQHIHVHACIVLSTLCIILYCAYVDWTLKLKLVARCWP